MQRCRYHSLGIAAALVAVVLAVLLGAVSSRADSGEIAGNLAEERGIVVPRENAVKQPSFRRLK